MVWVSPPSFYHPPPLWFHPIDFTFPSLCTTHTIKFWVVVNTDLLILLWKMLSGNIKNCSHVMREREACERYHQANDYYIHALSSDNRLVSPTPQVIPCVPCCIAEWNPRRCTSIPKSMIQVLPLKAATYTDAMLDGIYTEGSIVHVVCLLPDIISLLH